MIVLIFGRIYDIEGSLSYKFRVTGRIVSCFATFMGMGYMLCIYPGSLDIGSIGLVKTSLAGQDLVPVNLAITYPNPHRHICSVFLSLSKEYKARGSLWHNYNAKNGLMLTVIALRISPRMLRGTGVGAAPSSTAFTMSRKIVIGLRPSCTALCQGGFSILAVSPLSWWDFLLEARRRSQLCPRM